MLAFRWIADAIARFRGARSGATAVEFALVAPWFFLLTFGLAEVAFVGFAQSALDGAVADTGRLIRTGQAQTQNLTSDQVKKALCDDLKAILPMDCANLYLDVKTYPSFSQITNTSPINASKNFNPAFGYSPGTPASIEVVRAYYQWNVMTPLMQPLLQNTTNSRILASTMMFRNEPYNTNGP